MTGLRIAMVVPDFPRIGGYERQALGLSHRLLKMGHQPYLVTNARPGKNYPLVQGGLELVVLTERPRFRENPLLFMRAFLHHLKRRPAHCLHAHAMAPFSSAGLMAADSLGIPGVLKLAGVGDKEAFRASNDLNFRMARRGPQVAAHTISLCKAMDDVALSFGAPSERITHIPNGVDLERFSQTTPEKISELKASLGIEPNKRVLLYVGRLSSEKGLATLMSAVLPLLEQHAELVLCLVGDGPMRGELEALVEKSGLGSAVVFVGFEDEPTAYYAMADVFVLPSHAEGMSNALLEAMASGLPVAATDVGAAQEMLGQGYALARPQDAEGFREVLEQQLRSLDAGEDVGQHLKSRCQQHFSMDVVSAKYVALYQELAKRPTRTKMQGLVQVASHAMGALLGH